MTGYAAGAGTARNDGAREMMVMRSVLERRGLEQVRGVRKTTTHLALLPALALCALLASPAEGWAQVEVEPPRVVSGGKGTPRFASPFLPADHWAHRAARRLEGLGLAQEGFGGRSRSRTQREMAALFERAELEAGLRAPELVPLVAGYRRRFAEEFGWTTDAVLIGPEPERLHLVDARLWVGYEDHAGRVLTGVGYSPEDDWTGTRPVPDRDGRASGVSARLAVTPHAALSFSPSYREDSWQMDEAQLVLNFGALGLWGGRREVGFHQGAGGGIVLSPNQVMDGGGLFLADPVRLPWILRHLGPVGFEFFASRIENGDRIESPWFAAMHGSLHPHPRLELGFSRANIFGGKGNTPATFQSVTKMLFGFHAGEDGEFNNEVFSADIRYRPPLGPVPLAVYMEWGMDDSAGAWRNVPARVIGAEIVALPLIPQVALGVERTTFAEGCCGNTIWYRNWSLRGGWAADGRPLGHPLGGHGTEWLGHVSADLLDARAQIGLHLFTRERGNENLFAPERAGKSRGGRVSFDGMINTGFGVFLQAQVEDGEDGWRESGMRVGVQVVL